MSKKTNPVVLRLGYNIFWLQKKNTFFAFRRFYSLIYFLQQTLKNFFLFCFNIKFIIPSIILKVYNKSKYFNTLNKMRIVQFKIFELESLSVKKKKVLCKIKNLKFNVLDWKKFNLKQLVKNKKKYINFFHTHFQLIYSIFYITKYNLYLNWCYKLFYYKNLVYYYKTKFNLCNINYTYKYQQIKFEKKINKKIAYYLKIDKLKILNILNFKLIGLSFELLLNVYYNRKYIIIFNNILNSFLLNDFIEKNQYKNLNKQKHKIYFLMYTLFYFKNVELVARYISFLINKSYRHKRNISFFRKMIYYLWTKKVIKFKGLNLCILGKLNGKMKRSKFYYRVGKFGVTTFLNEKIVYYYLPLYTKFGVFSIKLQLLY